MSSVSGTSGAAFQLVGSGSLRCGVAAGAALVGVGRSGRAEPLGVGDFLLLDIDFTTVVLGEEAKHQ